MCYSFFTDVNRRTTSSAIAYRQCMQLPASGCMPRSNLASKILDLKLYRKSTTYFRLCFFCILKGLYFNNDWQNHRPSLCLAVYEFADMIFQGLLDQIPLGGPGFR